MQSNTKILINVNFEILDVKDKRSELLGVIFKKTRDLNEVAYHAKYQDLYIDIYENDSPADWDTEIKYSEYKFEIRLETFGGKGFTLDSYRNRHAIARTFLQSINMTENFDALIIDDEFNIVTTLSDVGYDPSKGIEYINQSEE